MFDSDRRTRQTEKMRVLLPIIAALSLGAHAEIARVTCGQQNACVSLQDHLAKLEKDQFLNTPVQARRERFIAWLKPFALNVQALTAYPASILISQAAYHSKWGTSEAFREGKNIFGFICSTEKAETVVRFEARGQSETVRSVCSTMKVDGKMKLLYTYPSYEASLFSYLNLLLNSHLRAYKSLQAQAKHAYLKIAPGVAQYRLVLGFLGDFDSRENYRSEIARLIDENHLQDLDNNACQNCLFQQRHIKDLIESTQPKAKQ